MRGPLLAVAGAIVLLAAVLAFRQSNAEREADAPAPLPLPTGAGQPARVSTTPQQPQELCCGGRLCTGAAKHIEDSACADGPYKHCDTCESGRTYVAKACKDSLGLEQPWRLRLARLDMPGASAGTRVCVRRASEPPDAEVCMDAEHGADMPKGNRATNRAQTLAITTKDLVRVPGLAITIRAGDEIVARRSNALHEDGNLRTSALCIGTRFKVENAFVSFYLDDP
jgi:hypothetical protein